MSTQLVLLPGMDGTALYLQASADRLVGARFADEYVAHLREPRLLRVEGPHLLLQANSEHCAKAIVEFIADCR